MTSSLLKAAGSPWKAASVSVCNKSRTRGQLAQKAQGQRAGRLARVFRAGVFRRGVFEALANFILQSFRDRIHQGGRLGFQLGGMDGFLVEEAGEQQAQQIQGDGGNGGFGRQVLAVNVIDPAHARIRGDQLIG